MENLTTIIGGNAVINDDNKTITVTNIGGTGKDNINDAIKAAYDKNETVSLKPLEDGYVIQIFDRGFLIDETPIKKKGGKRDLWEFMKSFVGVEW